MRLKTTECWTNWKSYHSLMDANDYNENFHATLLEGGRTWRFDPCRDWSSTETSSQADVGRSGTPLSELEPQIETGRKGGGVIRLSLISSPSIRISNRIYRIIFWCHFFPPIILKIIDIKLQAIFLFDSFDWWYIRIFVQSNLLLLQTLTKSWSVFQHLVQY